MTNLLAILVSLAMMFTGAAAPVVKPVSRTLQVGNLTVRHNDEEVTLSPCASLGVMTDGAKAVFDFSVTNGSEVYLPFQAAADENGLLILSDNADVTLKIDSDQIEELLSNIESEETGLTPQTIGLIGDYINAYAEMFRLMSDPDQMQVIQAKADEIYDEMVDRGEGVKSRIQYDGETYDVLTYEYDLDGAQIGALSDAVYATNEALSNYAEVYFRLLKSMPGDNELAGVDSFEAIMQKLGGVSMHVTEAIAENGLNISDTIIRFALEQMDAPIEFVVHAVKDGEGKSAEMNAHFDVSDSAVDLYMESMQNGGDMQIGMSVAVNPAGSPAEELEIEEDAADTETLGQMIVATADDEDGDDEDDEDDEDLLAPVDDEAEDDPVDGEGDGQDQIYLTVDFDMDRDEDDHSLTQSLSYTLDVAEQQLHAEYAIDGTLAADGEGAYQVSGELDIGEETYGFDLTATLSNAPIEVRADAEGAVSLDAFDPSAVIGAASTDVVKLYGDESVQKLIAMVQSAVEAAEAVEPVEIIEDVEAAVDGDIEQEEWNYGEPTFNWLPEGYAVGEVNVDKEYRDTNCTIVNEATGDSVYIDIGDSYTENDVNHYAVSEDGTCQRIEGAILNEEINSGYSMYSFDNGTLSFTVFPGRNTTTEDIARILSAITF